MKNKSHFSRTMMVFISLIMLGVIVAVPAAPAHGWPALAPQQAVANPYPDTYSGIVKLQWAAEGTYDKTLIEPQVKPDLDSIDLGFLANCSNGNLSGYVNLSATLVFPKMHTITISDDPSVPPQAVGPSISGKCSATSLEILSEKFEQTINQVIDKNEKIVEPGETVTRQFQLIGALNAATNAYEGEYRETLQGYGPQPVTMVGKFTLFLSSSTQETQEYTLTVNSAHGTVAKNPDWPTYHNNDIVELSVTPGPGWSFSGWTPSLTNNRITITDNTTITANFSPIIGIFADVPSGYWAQAFIEQLYRDRVTNGCGGSPLNYCPETPVTRTQAAIFILKAKYGGSYTPPTATGTMFSDVSTGTFGAAWIEQLAAEGITSGCGGGKYCPAQTVTRAQMAVFLVRAIHGTGFTPPAATGVFTDVPVGSFGADYIEQLALDGVTSGCGGGNFCPQTLVKRDSMAVFLVKAFSLP